MHDFHLANEIVKIAGEEARKSGFSKIEKILIQWCDIIDQRENISPGNSPGSLRGGFKVSYGLS